jgi:hypothetical protein
MTNGSEPLTNQQRKERTRSAKITALKVVLVWRAFVYAYSYFDGRDQGAVMGAMFAIAYIVACDYWSPHNRRFVIGAALSLTLLELPLFVLIPWQNVRSGEIWAIGLPVLAFAALYFKLLHKFTNRNGPKVRPSNGANLD